MLLALRTLSSLHISKQDLLDHPLGALVRKARKHGANAEIRQLAEKLIDKWKEVVLRAERSRPSKMHDFFGGSLARK